MVKEVKTYQAFLDAIKHIDAYNTYMSYPYFKKLCGFHSELEKNFIAFIAYDDRGDAIGGLPLLKRRIGYVVFGYRYSNYLGYVSTLENLGTVHESITAYLKESKKKYVINFYDINSGDVLFKKLNSNNLAKKAFLYDCPYTNVNINFDEFFVTHIDKSKKRAELKKFYRKLSEIGKLEIINIDDEATFNEYEYLMPQIFVVHKKRFCHTYIPDNLCMYKNAEYYTELFKELVRLGKSYLSIITLDGVVISFVYTSVSGSVIQDWMPAFDPIFSKYSLGTVHLMKMFEYVCMSSKYDVFDFSKGESVYKNRWTSGKTSNYAFAVGYNNTIVTRVTQKIILFPFCLKASLREKGYMGRIKKTIVWLKGNKKEEELELPIIESPFRDGALCWESFTFNNISKYSETIKEALLTRYYNEKFEEFAVAENAVYILH